MSGREDGLYRVWQRAEQKRPLDPGEARCERCKLPGASDLVDGEEHVCLWCRARERVRRKGAK